MTLLQLVLLDLAAVVVVTIGARQDNTPAAQPVPRMWAGARAAGWRGLLLALGITGAVLAIALYATGRAALYGLGVGVAAVCCWAATRAALSHRPCRVHLEFCA